MQETGCVFSLMISSLYQLGDGAYYEKIKFSLKIKMGASKNFPEGHKTLKAAKKHNFTCFGWFFSVVVKKSMYEYNLESVFLSYFFTQNATQKNLPSKHWEVLLPMGLHQLVCILWIQDCKQVIKGQLANSVIKFFIVHWTLNIEWWTLNPKHLTLDIEL